MKKNIYLDFGLEYELDTRLEKIKKAGFDGVYLWFYEDESKLDEMISKTRCFGLDIETFHLPYKECNSIWMPGSDGDKFIDLMIKGIITASKYNISTVVMHLVGGQVRPRCNEIGLNRMKRLVKICEEYKVNLALENVKEITHVAYIFDNIDSKYLKFCFDFGHINCFTKNTYSFDFNKYKDKLICVHIHDNDGENDSHLLPFYGTFDFKYVAYKLKEIGYSFPLTSEAKISKNHMFTEDEFINKVYSALNKIESYFEEVNE